MEICLSIATMIVITVSFGIVIDLIYRLFNPAVEKQSWLKRVTSIIWGSLYGLFSGILVGTIFLTVVICLAFVLTSVFLYLINGEIADFSVLGSSTLFEIFNPSKWWVSHPLRMLTVLFFATVIAVCLGKFKLGYQESKECSNSVDQNSGSRASI
ncbi:hypothetical protein [Planctomicrobium sp. SH527]|uniref:hypothetical protein n=1 Tax=Planctomicrobium sp. SH527 TaxID=3448123 RepID=UPI003F5C0711